MPPVEGSILKAIIDTNAGTLKFTVGERAYPIVYTEDALKNRDNQLYPAVSLRSSSDTIEIISISS